MTAQSTSSQTTLARLQELLPQLFQTVPLSGQPYLRFLIADQVVGVLPIEVVRESLLVTPDKITALPNLPRGVLGLMSSREQVLSVVNLPLILGYPNQGSLRRYHIVVVSVPSATTPAVEHDSLLGLLVTHIQGGTRLQADSLCKASDQTPLNLQPYVTGVFYQDRPRTDHDSHARDLYQKQDVKVDQDQTESPLMGEPLYQINPAAVVQALKLSFS